MNALYCILILLSIIPTAIPQYLNELFDIFLHLASLNYKCRIPEDQLFHLQIGRSYFFQHLYGMYPCNFIAYLQDVGKEHKEIFAHIIHPLLETVKMHPMLLTSNRDQEKSNIRWNGMEPHDVVVECSRFSLDHIGGGGTADPSADRINLLSQNGQPSVSEQLRHSMKTSSSTGISLQFYSLFNDAPPPSEQQQQQPQRIDNMWSPMLGVLATPPPSTAVPLVGQLPPPHTPTAAASHSFAVQTPVLQQQQQCASGASPPEAAVEATPETTPMKDCAIVRTYPTNSPAVRAIWGVSSQPSSPLKKNVVTGTAFRYGAIDAQQIVEQHQLSSPKIRNFVTERSMYQQLHQQQLAEVESPAAPFNNIINRTDNLPIEGIDRGGGSSSTKNSQQITEDEINRIITKESTTTTDTSADESPTKTLQVPTPVDNWRRQLNESSDDSKSGGGNGAATEFISRSLPAESALSKRRRTKKLLPPPAPPLPPPPQETDATGNKNVGTQTVEQIQPLNYDDLFESQSTTTTAAAAAIIPTTAATTTAAIPPMSPHTLLDQYIEATSKKTLANPAKLPEMYRDQIYLLNLLLQFERYRREVHAERNRRLLGKSRTNAALEMDNRFLREQELKLSMQVEDLTQQLNEARIARNQQEHEYAKELIRMRREQQMERDDAQLLRESVDALQRKLGTETTVARTVRLDLDGSRAELFDLRNELQQVQHVAEMGHFYRDELNRLQAEVLLMGELQMKCKEKMSELSGMRAHDEELNAAHVAYNHEVQGIICEFHTKLHYNVPSSHRYATFVGREIGPIGSGQSATR